MQVFLILLMFGIICTDVFAQDLDERDVGMYIVLHSKSIEVLYDEDNTEVKVIYLDGVLSQEYLNILDYQQLAFVHYDKGRESEGFHNVVLTRKYLSVSSVEIEESDSEDALFYICVKGFDLSTKEEIIDKYSYLFSIKKEESSK